MGDKDETDHQQRRLWGRAAIIPKPAPTASPD
jgi:hypothetical protein